MSDKLHRHSLSKSVLFNHINSSQIPKSLLRNPKLCINSFHFSSLSFLFFPPHLRNFSSSSKCFPETPTTTNSTNNRLKTSPRTRRGTARPMKEVILPSVHFSLVTHPLTKNPLAHCTNYLCPSTLACVHFPHHCPCAFPDNEDKIELGDGSALCISKGGWKPGEATRKVQLARKGLI